MTRGGSTNNQDIVSITDPASNEIITDKDKIKEITLKYCGELLTNREPKEEYRAQLFEKKKSHIKRMHKYDEDKEYELTYEMFTRTINDLKKKHGDKYCFILRAGNSYKDALFKLYKAVWKNEILPQGWKKTTITQIYKAKESRQT